MGSAVNQASRQIGSVLGVALTVALVGHAALQRADFNALYLLHGALALLTGLLCLPVDTKPRAAPPRSSICTITCERAQIHPDTGPSPRAVECNAGEQTQWP